MVGQLKGDRLVYLAKKTSKQQSIQTVEGILLAAFSHIYSDQKEAEQEDLGKL